MLKPGFKKKLKMQTVVIKRQYAGQRTKARVLSELATVLLFLAKRGRQDHAGENAVSLKYSCWFQFLQITSRMVTRLKPDPSFVLLAALCPPGFALLVDL